ncbi:flippase [Bifidobacterium pseudolongum]|uniref:flippase n=1 Tax=Bifidobacterium pseudolongum TaxID=1694 RepID=UPI001F0E69CE|nr:flippase [Bifidobacterium pseudolongum]MCH4851963.1 flippase [Bifidobacterium pseudolongum]
MAEQKPKIRSVKYNVLMNMILTTSSFIFPLITVPYVSRVIGPDGMGAISWAQTFVSYFSLVAVLGINAYGIREVARVRNDQEKLSAVTQELMTILVVSTAITYAVFLLTTFTIPKAREDEPLMLIFGASIWLTSCGINWFYQGIEQYGYITARNLVFKALGLVLMFAFVHQSSDYRTYAVILIIGSAGSNLFNLIKLHEYVHFNRHRKLNIRRHFKPMFSFTVSSISSGMYGQLDMLFLGFLGTNNAMGLYQLVAKIRNIAGSAVNSVGSVMLPRLSYYESQEDGHDRTSRLVAKNLNFLFIAGLLFIAGIVICADPIILILGGQQYLGARLALIISSLTILFSPINTILSQYMIARGQEKLYAIINTIGLVGGVMLCLSLIPTFGIAGAALSSIGIEIITLVLRGFFVRSFLREITRHLDFGRIFIAFALSSLIGFATAHAVHGINVFGQFIICALAIGVPYLALLLLFRESFICSILKPIIAKIVAKVRRK